MNRPGLAEERMLWLQPLWSIFTRIDSISDFIFSMLDIEEIAHRVRVASPLAPASSHPILSPMFDLIVWSDHSEAVGHRDLGLREPKSGSNTKGDK